MKRALPGFRALAAILLVQAGCVPEIQERCRLLTDRVQPPSLPPEFAPLDRLLIQRALCMTHDVRGLRGSLARSFRISFAEDALPILCGRLERARELAADGRRREAGLKYQSLLVASQIFELAIAVHAFSEYADEIGVPSARIMEMQEQFAGHIGPLLAAALTEDPAQLRQALSAHGAEYGAWVDALGRWSSKVQRQAERVRVARIVWDIGMLVIATYDAASEAAEIASPRPPAPVLDTGGGAAMAGLSAASYLELAEVLRKLIASGAIDTGVVVGLAQLSRAQALVPTRLLMERMEPSAIKPGMELDPTKEPIFRGGTSFTLKPGEIKIDPVTGLAKPTHGVSLDANPESLERFGGAKQLKSIPPQLKIVQRGARLEHFEIVPREPMSPARFQELLDQIELH